MKSTRERIVCRSFHEHHGSLTVNFSVWAPIGAARNCVRVRFGAIANAGASNEIVPVAGSTIEKRSESSLTSISSGMFFVKTARAILAGVEFPIGIMAHPESSTQCLTNHENHSPNI